MYKASDVKSKYGYDPMPLDLSRIPDWERFVQAMNYAMMKQFRDIGKHHYQGSAQLLFRQYPVQRDFYPYIARVCSDRAQGFANGNPCAYVQSENDGYP